MTEPLVVGAVAYAAKVVPIWEGIRDYFRGSPQPMDYVLFSNYERQVDALLSGQIDVAWNTNLAWVRTVRRSGGRCVALAMRDTDLGYRTLIVARRGSGPRSLRDLEGRRLISSTVRMSGRSTMPWIKRRCFRGSMSGTPPAHTSK